jgi:tRNA threonylcarbamoyladenosine biosynthesis protein TsaB
MKTLALDTSGPHQSVAVLHDGELCGEINLEAPSSHTVSLLTSIQTVLDRSACKLSDVGLFAVTVGPGSFTGIRIGLSTVKGLCKVCPRPIAAVSSLLALAWPHLKEGSWVIPCLDARLGELYSAAYRLQPGGMEVEARWEPQAMAMAALLEKADQIPGEKLMVGSGVRVFPELVSRISGAGTVEGEAAHRIRAVSVGLLGERMMRRGEVVSGHQLKPVYLRVSEAERRLVIKVQKKL